MILTLGGMTCEITDVDHAAREMKLKRCDSGAEKIASFKLVELKLSETLSPQDVSGGSMLDLASSEHEKRIITRIPVSDRSTASISAMLSKLRWIDALKGAGVILSSDLDSLEIDMRSVAASLPEGTIHYEASTIRLAWQELNRADGDPRALLPMYHLRGGPGQRRTDGRAEELLLARFNRIAADKNAHLHIADFVQDHIADVAIENAKPGTLIAIESLSPMTVARRFHERFTEYEVIKRNKGVGAAERSQRTSGVRPRAEVPLGASQYDDTDGEVFLISEKSCLPWGRANLTLGVCEASQSILGSEVGERPASTWSAISAFASSILQRDMSREEYQFCENPWFAHGHQGRAQFDNAKYFKAANLIDGVVADARSIPSYSIPKTPTGKSQVEHVNHIVKTHFSPSLPGWRGPKRGRDGLKDGPGTATLYTGQYVKLFNKWVCDVYSNMPGSDGLTSRQRWERYFRDGVIPMTPIGFTDLKLICTLREKHHFRDSGGILRLGLRYGCRALDELRTRIGSKADVLIRIHPYDLSELYVFDPIVRNYIVVPCLEDPEYTRGLTNYQQQLILKTCRDAKIKNPSIIQLVKGRDDLRGLTQQLEHSNKMRERRRAQRLQDAPDTPSGPGESSPQPQTSSQAPGASSKEAEILVMTDLEDQVTQLDLVELSDNDFGWDVPEEAIA